MKRFFGFLGLYFINIGIKMFFFRVIGVIFKGWCVVAVVVGGGYDRVDIIESVFCTKYGRKNEVC